MVSYATGEMVSKVEDEERDDGSTKEETARTPNQRGWRAGGLGRLSCYEIVTVWVHSHYRNMNFSGRMYSTVFENGEGKLNFW